MVPSPVSLSGVLDQIHGLSPHKPCVRSTLMCRLTSLDYCQNVFLNLDSK